MDSQAVFLKIYDLEIDGVSTHVVNTLHIDRGFGLFSSSVLISQQEYCFGPEGVHILPPKESREVCF
jgi:hypothetical protein